MNLGGLQKHQELIKANGLGSMKHRLRFPRLRFFFLGCGGGVLPLSKHAMDHSEK